MKKFTLNMQFSLLLTQITYLIPPVDQLHGGNVSSQDSPVVDLGHLEFSH